MTNLSSEKFTDLHSRLMAILSADTTVSFGRVQTAFSFYFCGKTCYVCVAARNDQLSSPAALVTFTVSYAGMESRSEFLGRVAFALLSRSSSLPSWFCCNPFDTFVKYSRCLNSYKTNPACEMLRRGLGFSAKFSNEEVA